AESGGRRVRRRFVFGGERGRAKGSPPVAAHPGRPAPEGPASCRPNAAVAVGAARLVGRAGPAVAIGLAPARRCRRPPTGRAAQRPPEPAGPPRTAPEDLAAIPFFSSYVIIIAR